MTTRVRLPVSYDLCNKTGYLCKPSSDNGGCLQELCQTAYLRTMKYSKIPIIRPPLRLSKSGLKDHFGQSQRWSLITCTLVVENEEKIA